MISPEIVLYVLDMIGIVACATAGTILAMKKQFDFWLSARLYGGGNRWRYGARCDFG